MSKMRYCKILAWTDNKKEILYEKDEEFLICREVIDIEIPRETSDYIWNTVFINDEKNPGIFDINSNQGKLTIIITHGESDGTLLGSEEIFSYLDAFGGSEKITVVCCYPKQVKIKYPKYREFIFGDWDDVIIHSTFNPSSGNKNNKRLISSVIINRTNIRPE